MKKFQNTIYRKEKILKLNHTEHFKYRKHLLKKLKITDNEKENLKITRKKSNREHMK